MRDLITGGAACAVPGSSSSSNPFGALAGAILGSTSKLPEVRGLPGSTVTVPEGSSDYRPEAPLSTLPGSEFENRQYQHANAQNSEFLQGFRPAVQGEFAGAWNEAQQRPVISQPPWSDSGPRFAEFEQIYNDPGAISQLRPTFDGPPQKVLSSFLHSFMNSGRAGIPFQPTALPTLGLSEGDKQCIRDRSCIMARHIYADKSEEFINAQVNAMLHSLDIDSDQRMKGYPRGHFPELEEYWTESQGPMRPGMPPAANQWVTEFRQQQNINNPEAWANSFQQMHGSNGWASEFAQEQLQLTNGRNTMMNASNAAAEQAHMLAQTLAQNADPKFQNSKFLQFVSKMSRGELIVDDNQIKPATESISGNWASEYETQYNTNSNWANQYLQDELSNGTNKWANEFETQHTGTDDQWVNEFSKLNIENDWAEEFGQGFNGDGSAEKWIDSYDQFVNDEIKMSSQLSSASKGVYVFSDMNPYVGHPNPLKEGQELFRKGLLSEAVLALEAEVLKNPDNAEGWRLLGITHAENDDDQQAIASMMRSQEADPTNLEVLLALGVSYTNELEQPQALRYLFQWLQNHPKYGSIAPPDKGDSLYYADVAGFFRDAAEMSPEDADVHIVLGVLYNLSREYDKAIQSFENALKLRPRDYSLWNKLGATKANSVQSSEAILAYQQALDLKPNYVRAWANMGISYANQGLYEESIRYYVRALAMNPKADNAWNYLKISLSCASRNDMFEACDSRNIDILQKEFPL